MKIWDFTACHDENQTLESGAGKSLFESRHLKKVRDFSPQKPTLKDLRAVFQNKNK